MSVIEAYGWKHVTILYEDNNALIRLKVRIVFLISCCKQLSADIKLHFKD